MATPHPAPFSDWTYRKKITIQSSQVDATLTDFPVYLDLADLGSDFFSGVKSDGSDIRIAAANGTTELARDVVGIDTGLETGELHFKAPSLSSSTDTDFYIYYGNAVATEPAVSATNGRNTVWSDYAAVYHMEGSPASAVDSAGNISASDTGTITSSTGKHGEGFDFQGSNDWLDLGDNTEFDWTTTFTLQAWAYTNITSSDGTIISKGSSSSAEILYWFDADTNDFTLGTTGGSGFVNGSSGNSSPNVQANTWYMTHATYGSGTQRQYTNAVLRNAKTQSTSITQSTNNLYIGDQTGGGRSFDGVLDEVRITKLERSANWISTEYNNQSSPATFYTIGTEEEGGGATGMVVTNLISIGNITTLTNISSIIGA
jgi:hypothetical protein